MVSNQGTSGKASRDDRLGLILEHVMGRGRIEVADLARLLDVSRVTIRKDLDALEERGLLRREHGVAVAGSTDDIAGRLAYHRAVKSRIAAAAAELVADGETVMIESGSVCALLAETLARANRGITIVTNSIFIAGYLRPIPNADVILLGGAFQARSEVTVGPQVAQAAAQYWVDKLFVGVDGYAPGVGFMAKDVLRTEAVTGMAARAQRLVLVTESEKFHTQGSVRLASTSEVSDVVTDNGIPGDALAELRGAGVNVLTVPAEADAQRHVS